MTLRSLRLFWLGAAPLALAACTSPGPAAAEQPSGATPVGIDLGSSPTRGLQGRAPGEHHPTHSDVRFSNHEKRSGGEIKMAQAGQAPVQGTGTVNSVDASARKIKLNHDPIAAIGWPAMTMDFAVAPSVDLGAVKPGTRVNFQMMQGQGGTYVIQSVAPAGGGR